MRRAGFAEDTALGAPVCRWVAEGIVLDVMPTDPGILGFTNRWFRPAIAAAHVVALPSGAGIRVVTAPYFLATKLEAFDVRGGGDYLASHDLEDIVTLVDGRPEVVEEISRAGASLREFLAERFSALVSVRSFVEALPAHLPPDAASQARLPLLLRRLRLISRL